MPSRARKPRKKALDPNEIAALLPHALFPEALLPEGMTLSNNIPHLPAITKQVQFDQHTTKPQHITLDVTTGLRIAAKDIVARVPDFSHIDLERVVFNIFHSRKASQTLTYARCYPLSQQPLRRGRRVYRLAPIYGPNRHEARYVLAFAWSRFWDQSPRERLETLVHELYHIAPAFDGEARAFEVGGAHGHGRAWYDNIIRNICERHLPIGLEDLFPALSLRLDSNINITGDKLKRPRWMEVARTA